MPDPVFPFGLVVFPYELEPEDPFMPGLLFAPLFIAPLFMAPLFMDLGDPAVPVWPEAPVPVEAAPEGAPVVDEPPIPVEPPPDVDCAITGVAPIINAIAAVAARTFIIVS
jgi:hypothetical protein